MIKRLILSLSLLLLPSLIATAQDDPQAFPRLRRYVLDHHGIQQPIEALLERLRRVVPDGGDQGHVYAALEHF